MHFKSFSPCLLPLISTDPFLGHVAIHSISIPRCQTKTVCSHFFKMLCESVWWHVSHPTKTYQAWAQRQAKVSFKMKWSSTSCHVIVVCMKSNFIQRWRQWDSLTKLLQFCSHVHRLKRAFLFLSQPILSPVDGITGFAEPFPTATGAKVRHAIGEVGSAVASGWDPHFCPRRFGYCLFHCGVMMLCFYCLICSCRFGIEFSTKSRVLHKIT